MQREIYTKAGRLYAQITKADTEARAILKERGYRWHKYEVAWSAPSDTVYERQYLTDRGFHDCTLQPAPLVPRGEDFHLDDQYDRGFMDGSRY